MRQWLKRLFAALEIPAPDPQQSLRTHRGMERNIMLPVQAVAIGADLLFFCFDAVVRAGGQHAGCGGGNRAIHFLVLRARNLALAGLLLNLETASAGGRAMDGGHEQSGGRSLCRGHDADYRRLGQHFLLVVCRLDHPQRVSMPPGFSQLFLNFAISFCYVLAAVLDIAVSQQRG